MNTKTQNFRKSILATLPRILFKGTEEFTANFIQAVITIPRYQISYFQGSGSHYQERANKQYKFIEDI